MSLTVIQNATAVAKGGPTVPFSGAGGTAPYIYSVANGGAGGTINASTGLYTPPDVVGVDVVQVEDASAATSNATILIALPIGLFCDIIQTSMELDPGQVYLWDQKINIPIDGKLYVAVSVLSVKPFGNSNTFDSNNNEVQSANFLATLSLDILSRGTDARDRKEEVILALNSQYSEQQQELNSFRIFPISQGFVNISEVDGAAIPYRFCINVNIQYFVSKTQAVDYYDDFSSASVVSNP